jgi:peptidoglycan/xylan/chitin deacetylase (PgdA/CDA1 family)
MNRPIKIILVYHNIDTEDRFLSVTKKDFKRQINYLLDNDFNFLPLKDLLRSKNKSVALVFDDGLKSVLCVNNFLRERNIPFGLSLISEKISNNEKKYLKIVDLLKFNKNCEFYSHGVNHLDLTKLSERAVSQEVNFSKFILEKKIRKSINTFVYPFGKYNRKIFSIVKNAGYKNALSLLPFHLSSNCKEFCLPRVNINGFVGFHQFKFLISRWGNFYLHLAFFKKKLLKQDYLKK